MFVPHDDIEQALPRFVSYYPKGQWGNYVSLFHYTERIDVTFDVLNPKP